MELVLIKKQGPIKIYQGVVEVYDSEVYFLSTWNENVIQDLVTYQLDMDNHLTHVPEMKTLVYEILENEYVCQQP